METASLKSPTGTAQSLSPQARLGMLSPCRSFVNDHNNGLFGAGTVQAGPYTFQSDNAGWLTRWTGLQLYLTPLI